MYIFNCLRINMKSFLVILALHVLLLIVAQQGCLAKTTNCTYPFDFDDDESCRCDVDKVCVRKCCPENRVLKQKHRMECVDGQYRKNVWAERWNGNGTDVTVPNSAYTHLVVGFPCRSVFFADEDETFTADGKGVLTYQASSYSNFCMDFTNGSGTVLAAVCDDETTSSADDQNALQSRVGPILLIGSILFSSITLFVYALEPKLRTLQGRCLMCYLLCAILYSAILCLIRRDVFETSTTVCCSAGYFTLYSLLAGFFWLNVMCFDLWLALKRLVVHHTVNLKNFYLYSLYAWGSPLVVVCIAMSAQFSVIPWLQIKPTFGVNTCWFTKGIDEKAQEWYFSNIVTLLLIVNLVLFICTVYIVVTHNGQKKHIRKHDSKRHTVKGKRRFILFAKLFFMMSLNWISEFLPNHVSMSEEMIFVVGIPNLFQGFFIFAIFVCKRRVLALLNQRLYPSKIFIHERKPRKSSTQILTSTTSTTRSSRASSTRGPSFSLKSERHSSTATRSSLSTP